MRTCKLFSVQTKLMNFGFVITHITMQHLVRKTFLGEVLHYNVLYQKAKVHKFILMKNLGRSVFIDSWTTAAPTDSKRRNEALI